MFRNKIFAIVAALCISASGVITSWADTAQGITMENCGAYLFTWRPVDCGNGRYFAIISGGDTIKESDVVLNRGYDYAYTFDYTLSLIHISNIRTPVHLPVCIVLI